MTTSDPLTSRIKQLIVSGLGLDGVDPAGIGDDEPLMGERLGLDSVDALELVVVLEKEFGIRIGDREIDPESFSSVRRLAEMVERLREATTAPELA